jgi:glycosyl transferase family 2
VSLISYTLPCHKRDADLVACLPSVMTAANTAPPVEILVVDYGHPGTLVQAVRPFLRQCEAGVTLRIVRVEAEYFHMAHARNVGIRQAAGDIIVAFLADQIVGVTFFAEVRTALFPGSFLKWEETYICRREDILAAGGFDERFEFYGPEGKELADRLMRRGLTQVDIMRRDLVTQIRTSNTEKLRNYRESLSKLQMHQRGMDVWRDNMARNVLVANEGKAWGAHG